MANQTELNQLIQHSTTPVVALFTADWCLPCQILKEQIDALPVEQREKTQFVMIDMTDNRFDAIEMAQRYKVEAYPTAIIFKNHTQTSRVTGSNLNAILRDTH